ncbi:hypothetical protein [Deinococcus peraridilitoris]|uniref:Uncharacterized protein n=1 Tax=Deinococcus peraridilitoris (strain DSM 19664 / LMG 22246 / CIP 109416 / KR-200) TaxID=937777 RepID=L0A2A9_DEIPD|nr:hypothetical protein [Deinococcus peraridilitoris]AFZ67579.1 hypothetical protein Deipe_2083 [Deinococcus peraridilitoris DSM 19664]
MRWRLRIYSPTGAYRYDRTLDQAEVTQAGLTMTLEPYGNCLEANFSAKASSLGIGDRDIVQIQTRPSDPNVTDDTVLWTSRFAGIAVLSGARHAPDATGFKLVGLKKRLEEVDVTTSHYPQQSVHTTISQVIAHLTNGRLPAQMNNVTQVPDPSVTAGALHPNYQSGKEVLDKLVSLVPGWKSWGYNADFQLVIDRGEGVVSIDEAVLGTRIEWTPSGSEELITAVRWLIGNRPKVLYAFTGMGTYEVLPAGIVSSSSSLNSAFGYAAKVLALTTPRDYLKPSGTPVHASAANPGSSVSNISHLADDNPSTVAGINFGDYSVGSTQTVEVRWDISMTEALDLLGFELQNAQGATFVNVGVIVYQASDPAQFLDFYPSPTEFKNGLLLFGGPDIRALMQANPLYDSCRITLSITGPTNGSATIGTARPLLVDRVTLERLASLYYREPSPDPATIRLPGFVTPGATASIQRRTLDGSLIETLSRPVQKIEYRISAREYGDSYLHVGQRDDPEASALKAVIEQRDNQATLNAVRYGP